MTTIERTIQKCILCGTENDIAILISSNQTGPTDLDTRPSEMIRSTMFTWVHRCWQCGYTAPDLSIPMEKAAETIKTRAYRAQLEETHFSDLANNFLCLALIQEAAGQTEAAAWSTIEAAWDCDDESNLLGAAFCRLRAINLFEQLGSHKTAAIEAVLADLYRRTKQFDHVPEICQKGLASNPDKILRKVFAYQVELANAGDDACHSLKGIANLSDNAAQD
jgi:hypothetical protein